MTEEIQQGTEIQSTAPTDQSQKKGFSMPSAITILVGILFALIVLSWIVAWAGGTYEVDESIFISLPSGDEITLASWTETLDVAAMGVFGAFLAIGNGFIGGSDLIFYLFVLGAVIELMLVSGSMEAGIGSLVKGLGGKEIFLIPILFILFSAGGTIYGMSEETIALFVIVVPALALAGFDTVTGLMVILGGTATGCAVSTVNPFAMGAADAAIADAGVKGVMSSVLIFNLVWWAIMTAITCSIITGYAAFVKKNPDKSFAKSEKEKADKWLEGFSNEDSPTATGRQKAALAVFMLAFLLMIVLFIPWADLVGLDYTTGNKDPIFGLIAPLGTWYFGELSMMFIFVGVIIALILGMPKKQTTDAAWDGAKAMFSVAIVISVARGIPYIMETTGLQPWLLGAMLGGLGDKDVSSWVIIYTMFFVIFVLSTVITSTSGLAAAALPMMTSIVVTICTDATGTVDMEQAKFIMGGVAIAYMMGIGFWNFFVPTNPIVMASMEYSRVPYQDGVKLALPMALVVLVVTLAAMIPSYILIMG